MASWFPSLGDNCISDQGIPMLSCIYPLFRIILGAALDLAGVVSLFMIIYAGIKFIMSGGGKQVDEAKNILTYAIIGLVIVLLAYFIVSLISGLTGVTCILTFSASCP